MPTTTAPPVVSSRSVALTLVVALSLAFGSANARDGDLDRSFGVNGKAFPAHPSGDFIDARAAELQLQSDGKILIASSRRFSPADYDFSVLRLQANGTVDTTFGLFGMANVAFDRPGSEFGDHVVDLAVQSDGKIILAGYVDGDAGTGTDMGLVRLLSTGVVDTSYGTSGKVVVQFNLGGCTGTECNDVATRLNLQADGKALLVGAASDPIGYSEAIVRLTTSGQRDSTFDSDGRLTLTFGNGDRGQAFRARQLSDGVHIVVVGFSNLVAGDNNNDFTLARLNDNGSLDPTFGVGGKMTYGFDIGGTKDDLATDFIELADGRLVVCGAVLVNNPSNYDFGCMRFLANGTPDSSYSPVLIPFDAGGDLDDLPLRMARDDMGRIVLIGGASVAPDNYDFAVARLTPAGALDPSFGTGGIRRIDSLPGTAPTERGNIARGIGIQPDGKIVISGNAGANVNGDQIFQVVRLVGDTILADGFE